MRTHAAALLLVLSASTVDAQTRAAKPAIPPAQPTQRGGIPVIAEGFDYTKPSVLKMIGRDGEGTAIAYDAVDDDARPFLADAATTALIEASPAMIAPIRVDGSAIAWTRAFAFAARTPARIVIVLTPAGDHRVLIEAAMRAAPDRLFIVAATDAPKLAAANALTIAALPKAGDAAITVAIADVVLVPPAAAREAPGAHVPASSSDTAAYRAVQSLTLFACAAPRNTKTGADIVTHFVARAQKGPPGTAPLLEHCG